MQNWKSRGIRPKEEEYSFVVLCDATKYIPLQERGAEAGDTCLKKVLLKGGFGIGRGAGGGSGGAGGGTGRGRQIGEKGVAGD